MEIETRLNEGRYSFEITIPPRLLAPTTYLLTIGSASKYSGVLDHRHNCCEFTLCDLDSQNETRPGVLGIRLPWSQRAITPVELDRAELEESAAEA
jgi:lipopolysaccharide transport system ATP-binding protein